MALVRTLAAAFALLLLLPSALLAQSAVENVDERGLELLMARKVPLIDIRTPPEWAETGTIAGSHRIMAFDERGKLSPDFIEKLAKVAKPSDEMALICRTGSRTRLLARAMAEQLGYTHVYNVEKGITNWIRSGRPVEK